MGLDPWYHIFIVNYMDINKILPMNFYFDNLGLHIFTLNLHYFTDLEIFLIPRYFIFFTFFIGSLIVYNILKKVFNEHNLAIMGVFLIEISFLGFSFMQYQFWPTSLAVFQCLTIFYLLYNRQKDFLNPDPPKRHEIKNNRKFTYIFIMATFFSSIFIHSLVTMIFLLSFALIYVVYFLKDKWRGFDLIILLFLFGIFGFLLSINFGTGHFTIILMYLGITDFKILVVLVVGIPGLISIFYIIKKSIDFESGKWKKMLNEKRYMKLEKKFVIPIIICILLGATIFFMIGEHLDLFSFSYSTILMIIQDGIFLLFSV
jgi:hypothetical protein